MLEDMNHWNTGVVFPAHLQPNLIRTTSRFTAKCSFQVASMWGVTIDHVGLSGNGGKANSSFTNDAQIRSETFSPSVSNNNRTAEVCRPNTHVASLELIIAAVVSV